LVTNPKCSNVLSRSLKFILILCFEHVDTSVAGPIYHKQLLFKFYYLFHKIQNTANVFKRTQNPSKHIRKRFL